MPDRPPWTDLVRWLDWTMNHPWGKSWSGYPDSRWGPRSERLCRFVDRITNNWAHD